MTRLVRPGLAAVDPGLAVAQPNTMAALAACVVLATRDADESVERL